MTDKKMENLVRILTPGSAKVATEIQVKLLREYFRRMALWARELDCEEAWPFFSVAERLGVNIELPVKLPNISGLQEMVIKYTLQWNLANIDAAQYSLPDPYEPIIELYRNGEFIYFENGFIFLNSGAGVPIGRIKKYI